ncbi:putative sucrose-phosphate synthase 1 [Bidens hawaiensis]|uniref:putative sucrose-phosphate synthase 1 n=1 Tax=Bidens hawaiensis TaxID=980011 RepID=UPI0040495774
MRLTTGSSEKVQVGRKGYCFVVGFHIGSSEKVQVGRKPSFKGGGVGYGVKMVNQGYCLVVGFHIGSSEKVQVGRKPSFKGGGVGYGVKMVNQGYCFVVGFHIGSSEKVQLQAEAPESPSDSLRDMQDISLNLDGVDSEDKKSKLESVVLSYSKGNIVKTVSGEKSDQAKFPALRRRNHIFVIAIDTDNIKNLFENIKKVFEAVENEKKDGSVGFILATSLQMAEIHSFMVSNGLNRSDFDTFICNSSADLYYTSSHSVDNPLVFDLYYHSHIEYRWGGEGLRTTLVRWASSVIDKKAQNKNEEHVVTEDAAVSTNYCYAFNVRNPALVPPAKELRKMMRIHALRCHFIYCQNRRKINVIPVLASRSQALRYLYLRWGMDLTKVVVFIGESGDTDYEGFLGGVHKSVILKGVGNTNDGWIVEPPLSVVIRVKTCAFMYKFKDLDYYTMLC